METHIEDADSDSDSDIYDETSLESYTTPIDDENCSVDEYEVFKTMLEKLQTQSPDWYASLVGNLSADDAKLIQEVLTLCGQRKAAKESKSIEQAGGKSLFFFFLFLLYSTKYLFNIVTIVLLSGYSFQQQTVPNQFTFSPGGSGFTFGK